MIKCDDCRLLLSRMIDGELPPDQAERAGMHMSTCPACTAYARELAALDNALENLPEPNLPLTLQVFLRNLERERTYSWRGDLARAAACVATGGAAILVGQAFPGTVELLANLGIAIGSYLLLFSRAFRPLTIGSG
jgi:anti-sigma factor RsiW